MRRYAGLAAGTCQAGLADAYPGQWSAVGGSAKLRHQPRQNLARFDSQQGLIRNAEVRREHERNQEQGAELSVALPILAVLPRHE